MPTTANTNYNKYDAGKIQATTDFQKVAPAATLMQLLIYPAADGVVKLDSSEKEIYLPADTWTPISVSCSSFSIKVDEAADVHWQGWYI